MFRRVLKEENLVKECIKTTISREKLYVRNYRSQALRITEEQVKQLFSMFRDFVTQRNIPECKKFIQNYVDKVIVYKDHVEVIFNVVFNILKD